MRTTPRFAPGNGSVGRPNSEFNPASNNLEYSNPYTYSTVTQGYCFQPGDSAYIITVMTSPDPVLRIYIINTVPKFVHVDHMALPPPWIFLNNVSNQTPWFY